MKDKKIIILMLTVGVIALAAIGYLYLSQNSHPGERTVGGQKDEHGCLIAAGYSWCEAKSTCIRPWEEYCTATAGKVVTFTCADAKSINATFYIGDDKFVDLKLSDGRNMSVPHAVSGSGARYAKADESFVFWNRGDTAFITEGATSSTETYSRCALTVPVDNNADKTDLIRVNSPRPNETVSSPLTVTGEARGTWFFEASFPIFLTDWDGKIIAQGVAQAKGEWMTSEFVPFVATLEFVADKNAYSNKGSLILKKDNPSGLSEHDDALEIPIIFN